MKIRSVDRPEKIPSSRTRVQNRRCLQLDLVSLISLSHSVTHSLTHSLLFLFLFLSSHYLSHSRTLLSHLTVYLTPIPYISGEGDNI